MKYERAIVHSTQCMLVRETYRSRSNVHIEKRSPSEVLDPTVEATIKMLKVISQTTKWLQVDSGIDKDRIENAASTGLYSNVNKFIEV